MLKFDVTLLYVFVAFPIAYAILKRFLFRPLIEILDERERDERSAARIYAESLEELEKTVAWGQRELSRTRQEALKQREALRAEGRAVLERKLAEAQAAAKIAVESASREIEAQAALSAEQLPTRARGLAGELAQKILGRKLAA